MKLKPFDLEKAQAGHPWGTRDGRKGKKIFDTEREGHRIDRLIAIFENNELEMYSINGKIGYKSSEFDLFLYEEEKIGWVVIYRGNDSIRSRAITLKSHKNELEETTKANGTYLQTVEVRY